MQEMVQALQTRKKVAKKSSYDTEVKMEYRVELAKMKTTLHQIGVGLAAAERAARSRELGIR